MKELFEKINLTELAVVVATGVALIASVILGQSEAVLALGGGLVGYLGGVTTTGNNNQQEKGK